MWHVTGVCCRCAACSMSPAGEGCQNSLVTLQSLQYLQLRIARQLWWHPTGTSSDFFPRMTGICLINQWSLNLCRALLRPQCMLPASDGAAQGKFPHELGCLPLPGQWCKPCFQWRQYFVPPYSPMVHLTITSRYLVKKHECWPFSYRWDSGTCLLTRWRHGLSMNGWCQLLQRAFPPHLALITAGGHALAEWLSDAQTISGP